MNIEQILKSQNISEIAKFISEDWKKISIYAQPYLDAMLKIQNIKDDYFEDSAQSVVLYFLVNARAYRGDNARQIKQHLNNLIESI